MEKNDIVTLNITSVTSEGLGVGRVNGIAVFVKSAAIGDTVRAVIIKVNKNYCVGKLLEIITPSVERTDNDCDAFPRCGGCAFRHINYSEELKIKKQKVTDAFKRIGNIDVTIENMLFDKPDFYRNKAQYPVSDEAIGFYAEHSHRIIGCDNCKLQPDEFNQIAKAFFEFKKKHNIPAFDGKCGLVRHLYIRKGKVTGDILVCVVINGDTLPYSDELVNELTLKFPQIKSNSLNLNKNKNNVILGDKFVHLLGDGYIYDELCGVKVRISAQSFYQVNRTMAEKLYNAAKQYAGKGDVLVDLYCGAGTIGLSMAHSFNKVIGVEIVESAVKDAKFNAKLNNITNAEFYCGDAYLQAKKIDNKCSVLVVDPPRKGLDEKLPRLIAEQFCPKKIVYVSCDPATLARDCKIFSQFDYKVQKVTAADLFARTHHVETVCLLTKNTKEKM